MNKRPFEAKVRRSSENSTSLLIKVRDMVIQTEFTDLASCEFPIWSSAPVPVEIPPDGSKSYVVGPFSGSVTEKAKDGGFPNVIKFPVYKEQGIATANAYESLSGSNGNPILAKMPLAALATVVSGVVDGKLVQTHCVLPLWNDGSAVLVRLDWFEGEASEGTPNPEWHMTASTGLPAARGLAELEKASRLPSNATCCRYLIHLSPWLLVATLLEDKGQEIQDQIWQREWSFDGFAEFSEALGRITGGLLESSASRHRDAA